MLGVVRGGNRGMVGVSSSEVGITAAYTLGQGQVLVIFISICIAYVAN